MILLRLISWPYVRQHLPRWLLTIAGIVLGVAVFVGMHTANQTVLYAFHQTVDRIAGSTQLQISAGETGFDENVLDRVQAVPEVRVAVPVIEAVVNTGVQGQGNLLILGVDMLGDRSLRDYDLESSDKTRRCIDDPLVFLAQPDSLMVTDTFARENHLAVGAKVPMSTMDGQQAVHRSRHHEIGRPGQRLRRQSGRDGHLRRAEGFRPRPQVRSHRSGPERRREP